MYIHLDARPNKAWSSELFLLFLHALFSITIYHISMGQLYTIGDTGRCAAKKKSADCVIKLSLA